MSDIKSFAVVGGDKRMLFCAQSLAGDGFEIAAAGFSGNAAAYGLTELPPDSAMQRCDALLLPLPASKDGENLFAPYSGEAIPLSLFTDCCKPVFCGMRGAAGGGLLPQNVYYYADRADFKAANALPTAEGAIAAAMREYDDTLTGARLLVIGYGRIGRVLSAMLRGMGADVTVSARKSADREMIRAHGMKPLSTDALEGKYDIIFNTVPALVLDARTAARIASGGLVIDLASMPGGTDDAAAARLGIRVFHELALPGRVAPKAAGTIIKNTVLRIIREEKL